MNPFLQPYDTPHGTTPFGLIRPEHYEPAIEAGITEQEREIDTIVNNPSAPTFANTIEALECTGATLERVTSTLYNMLSAETSDALDAIAERVSPRLTEHSNNIALNARLFARVREVYASLHDSPTLTAEQQTLLRQTYDGFRRGGAELCDKDKQTLRGLDNELALLTLRFSQNKLKDTNAFTLLLTSEDDLDGLSETAIHSARQAADEHGQAGWLFTLHAPSYQPFLTYSTRRDLRQRMYMAYNTQCTHSDATDNRDIVRRLVNLRLQKAQLLGYEDYATYKLEHRMAQTPAAVYAMLHQLLDAYRPTAIREVEQVTALAREENGDDFQLMPWDFAFYANRLKQRLYDLNPEMLRPYFQLERVKKGVFGLATRLYGLHFEPNTDIPVYHRDVEAYDVRDADGTFLAVLYCDFHPRSTKKSGAWMTNFKEQWQETDCSGKVVTDSRPQVSIVMNLTRSTPTQPSLLTLDEVETFLHEFGHALHGMLARTHYRTLSGTNVFWDFVELPSQFMENYSTQRDFLNTFAVHYQTGEPMPATLIDLVVKSRNFNVAYACLRQLSFGFLDMAYYTRTTPLTADIERTECDAWQCAQLLPHVDGTCMSTQFSHIMSGGYSAGYYSYKWAEMLDADAFELFADKGIFDTDTAQRFRDEVLSKGGTEAPMTLYTRFRGKQPSVHALLRRNGIAQ